MATVELRNPGKRFGGFTAPHGLDLSIADGEFLVPPGPSGCCKTRMVRMVAGLERPTAGDILISGRQANDIHARERDLAMAFRNHALHPHTTAGQNTGHPLKVRGIGGTERDARVCATTKVAPDWLPHRRPASFSGGKRQRVARAILRRQQRFLMDEPLSNFDARLRTGMRRKAEAPSARTGDHHDPRHRRRGGGDDAGRPNRDPERRAHTAAGCSAETLAHPTSIVFDGTALCTANLGRRHITRISADIGAPPLRRDSL